MQRQPAEDRITALVEFRLKILKHDRTLLVIAQYKGTFTLAECQLVPQDKQLATIYTGQILAGSKEPEDTTVKDLIEVIV